MTPTLMKVRLTTLSQLIALPNCSNQITKQSILFFTAIMTPAAVVSAWDVIYEGFYNSDCSFEVNYANFTSEYDCAGSDLWPVASYKAYNTGADDCPEGKSLQVILYGTEGNGEVCGYDELAVLFVGDSQDCVEGPNVTPANFEAICA